jgi:hypothetical protein
MPNVRSATAPKIEPMSRTQFSLRTLLAAVAAVGLATFALQGERSIYAGVIRLLLVICFPALTATIGLNSHGAVRAFWVGAFFSALGAFLEEFHDYGSFILEGIPRVEGEHEFESLLHRISSPPRNMRHLTAFLWLSMPIVGSACAMAYRFAFGSKSSCGRPPEA